MPTLIRTGSSPPTGRWDRTPVRTKPVEAGCSEFQSIERKRKVGRVFNFSPGPAVLPQAILEQASDEMLDWHGTGMSGMGMRQPTNEFISTRAAAQNAHRHPP